MAVDRPELLGGKTGIQRFFIIKHRGFMAIPRYG
jgi:hypothetical protein